MKKAVEKYMSLVYCVSVQNFIDKVMKMLEEGHFEFYVIL